MTSILYRIMALVLVAGLSAIAYGHDHADAVKGMGLEGTAKADALKACVRPTDWMRRNHMELIEHQRDLTVRQGIRVQKDSLANCVDCHARQDDKGQPVPVTAAGEFCQHCHGYAAVKPSCFQCHSTVPSPAATAQR
ncbi:MAG: sulfur reduction protein DsrJ [Gammaproteobacteria bacterium]|nr:sulfur reduction protein DsrJ [Gammaproteobacteria bacterium]MBU1655630.1 sulfur reduction protein DsrJ [Gammaproteobacteria bacterium]MBU1962302.1 sulfur reduction protein DsrJ [Gammaproteobacteria bacterium]